MCPPWMSLNRSRGCCRLLFGCALEASSSFYNTGFIQRRIKGRRSPRSDQGLQPMQSASQSCRGSLHFMQSRNSTRLSILGGNRPKRNHLPKQLVDFGRLECTFNPDIAVVQSHLSQHWDSPTSGARAIIRKVYEIRTPRDAQARQASYR